MGRTMQGMALRGTVAALLGGMLLGGAAGAAAADRGPITKVDNSSPAEVAFHCGAKGEVVLHLRTDLDEDYYIQDAGEDVAIPVTCATAPIGLSSDGATISCNKSVSGTQPLDTVDGRDLADALARALGSGPCHRVR